MAQKCSWVKRTFDNTIDNWRLRLRLGSPCFDITLIKSIDFNPCEFPVLYELASAFELFVNCFSKIGNNLLSVPLFMNKSVTRSKSDMRMIDVNFFGKTFYNCNKNAIRKLTISDCLVDGNFKSLTEFADMQLPLTYALWMQLRSAVLLARKKIEGSALVPVSLIKFLASFKKGSKKFRDVIDRSVYQCSSVLDLTVVNSFAAITKTNPQPELIVKNFLSSWNISFLDNNFKEFLFKCRNNILKTRDRLSHILPGTNDTCILCKNIVVGKENRESFSHIFRSCTVTDSVILRINRMCNLQWNVNNFDFESLFWYGNLGGDLDRNTLLFYDIVRYQIWCMKLKRMINLDLLISNIFDHLNAIFQLKPAVRRSFEKNNNLSKVLQAMG
jgi:hypothetical protein